MHERNTPRSSVCAPDWWVVFFTHAVRFVVHVVAGCLTFPRWVFRGNWCLCRRWGAAKSCENMQKDAKKLQKVSKHCKKTAKKVSKKFQKTARKLLNCLKAAKKCKKAAKLLKSCKNICKKAARNAKKCKKAAKLLLKKMQKAEIKPAKSCKNTAKKHQRVIVQMSNFCAGTCVIAILINISVSESIKTKRFISQ